MTLKLYGRLQSTNTQRVILILKEKKIPYELVEVEFGQNNQPERLQFQPFAEIPYIDDDGFILYESRAIARYLVAAYPEHGPTLVPPPSAGLRAQALFEQALSVEAFNFYPTVSSILMERLFKPFIGQTPDEAEIATLTEKLDARLAGYERVLSKSKYLAGDEVTLADLFHIPLLTLFGLGQIDDFTNDEKVKKWPSVARWANELVQRGSVQA
ncbi:glutathione S-transferase [Favolaschia claudopus]|uniref:glutathione transferase n=1 Tax=Favolaschia claudopus TaxID=2862362 RepID=A0AAV9ZYB5_9AGAR